MIDVTQIIDQYLSGIDKLDINLLLLLLDTHLSWELLVPKDIKRPIVSALSSSDRAH